MTSVFDGQSAVEHAETAAAAIRAINHLTYHDTALPYPSDAWRLIERLENAPAEEEKTTTRLWPLFALATGLLLGLGSGSLVALVAILWLGQARVAAQQPGRGPVRGLTAGWGLAAGVRPGNERAAHKRFSRCLGLKGAATTRPGRSLRRLGGQPTSAGSDCVDLVVVRVRVAVA